MNERFFAIFDLGTSRTTLLQAQIEDGLMRYAGHITAPSQGMKKGTVVSPGAAAAAMRAAAATLEARTGAPIERVFLSLTGAHVKGVGSQAGLPLTSRSREVTREDVHRVLDLARSISLPEDRQILHVVPQEFVLDRQGGIHEPVGMLAARLEARIYAITVTAGVKDNLVLAANRAGLEVQELIFAPLGVAEACLGAEERQAGVAIVDLGAGSTGIAVYAQGSLAHAAVIPIGGDHFTNDIAIGIAAGQPTAERIKCDHGAVSPSFAGENSRIEVPGEKPGDMPGELPHRQLCEWIEPRAQELAGLIRTEVMRAGPLRAGIICSGGGGRLTGFEDLLQATLGLAVRPASPALIEGMPDELGEPEYAFTVGACYYAHRLLAGQRTPASVWEKIRARWAALGS